MKTLTLTLSLPQLHFLFAIYIADHFQLSELNTAADLPADDTATADDIANYHAEHFTHDIAEIYHHYLTAAAAGKLPPNVHAIFPDASDYAGYTLSDKR